MSVLKLRLGLAAFASVFAVEAVSQAAVEDDTVVETADIVTLTIHNHVFPKCQRSQVQG